MNLKTLLLLGAVGYFYLYLKNNNLIGVSQQPSITSPAIQKQGGTTTVSSTMYDVIINQVPVANIDKYQLIYDVVYDNKRYLLYVLKDWDS